MLGVSTAHLAELASARIGALLVRADKQNIWVIVKDVVCAIAVMHVIVKDHYLHA